MSDQITSHKYITDDTTNPVLDSDCPIEEENKL